MNCIYFCRFVILLIGLSLIRLINANSIGLSDEVMQSLNMVHVRLAAEAENLNYEQAIAYMRADYLDALANEDQYHADNNIESFRKLQSKLLKLEEFLLNFRPEKSVQIPYHDNCSDVNYHFDKAGFLSFVKKIKEYIIEIMMKDFKS